MLTIKGLEKRFGDLATLERLDLEVGAGEIVALLGPSGCGKTTLLNIIAGLIPLDRGEVRTGDSRIGYLFQEDRLLPWLTLEQNIAIVGDGDNADEVKELIALVGLEGFGGYYPVALSGGMRQRCAIARAYHYHCDLLLMDEPFKSLDPALRLEMLDVLMRIWNRRRTSVLLVTHELDEALAIASRILVLSPRPAHVRAEFTLEPAVAPRDTRTPDLEWIRQEVNDRFFGYNPLSG